MAPSIDEDFEGIDFNKKALSEKGQLFEVEDATRQILYLSANGILLVASKHANNIAVTVFIGRLQNLNFSYQKRLVDFTKIAKAYKGGFAAKPENTSDMQLFAMKLFAKAVDQHASDIHIRVNRDDTRVYFRIHNDMTFQDDHPVEFGKQLLTAIYSAMTDVADATFEAIARQDARISDRSKMPPGLDGIRIATTPQVGGHIMVMRLLYDDAKSSNDIETLGFTPAHAVSIRRAAKIPSGINLITGPTGSGKSTTLQRQLGELSARTKFTKNLITVEDPPEYTIIGAVQTPVTEAASETERNSAFDEAILSAMRLDPDIIMIGEIRDKASASLAFRAAMTGHQVWSTLHTIGVFPTFSRLLDLGISPELLYDADNVTSITSQRLAKKICPCCKKQVSGPTERYSQEDIERVQDAFGSTVIYVFGDGCEVCKMTATSGRTVVAETLVADREIMRIMREVGRSAGYDYWRQELKGLTMAEHALEKAKAGLIDPFEAESVVSEFQPSAKLKRAA